ncbi:MULTISPECIES: hypothetical protein [Enterococcus]|uniref:hypothetical protein n=1 Tax=Enterococcus TaxID=1350 RepID=UPI00035313E0|nr:hypothetical protein [Enterococcus faecalis]EPH92658.1 hypothetical protein D921_02180 [Enterococcus faecalis F01966]MEB7488023.1 hypothetical protein [Enterococcus faecalis]
MEFKEEMNLIFGWKLKAVNDSNIIVSSNESGYVALTYGSHQFGDIQTLLIKLDNDSVKLKSFPPVFNSFDVDIVNKLISVEVFFNS